jgi:hypothetical protein
MRVRVSLATIISVATPLRELSYSFDFMPNSVRMIWRSQINHGTYTGASNSNSVQRNGRYHYNTDEWSKLRLRNV